MYQNIPDVCALMSAVGKEEGHTVVICNEMLFKIEHCGVKDQNYLVKQNS